MSDPRWAYRKLLIQGNGVEGATYVHDERHHYLSVSGLVHTSAVNQPHLGGSSLVFGGSGNFVSVQDHADYVIGSSAFTLELKFRQPADATVYIMDKRTGTSSGFELNVVVTALGGLLVNISSNGTAAGVTLTAANGLCSAGAWHHMAVERVGANFVLYIDGVVAATATAIAVFNSPADLRIGAAWDGSFPFVGNMAGIRLTVGVNEYGAAFTPPAALPTYLDTATDAHFPNVVLNVPMAAGNQAQVFTDLSGHAVTPTGAGVKIVSGTYKFANASLSCNSAYLTTSSSDYLLGADDFTAEFWMHGSDTGSNRRMLDFQTAAGSANGLSILLGLRRQVYFNGTLVIDNATSFPTSTWEHVVLIRRGALLTLGQSGIEIGSVNVGTASLSLNGVIQVGPDMYSIHHMSNLRVTKGVARYTFPYGNVPVEPFPVFGPQSLSGHVYGTGGLPISRTVRAYNSISGQLVSQTVSDSLTGVFTLPANSLDAHFVIVHDPDGNASIFDHIVPSI